MTWMIQATDDRGRQLLHVMPMEDLREHLEAEDCWCRPEVDPDGFATHNSLDGREAFESGERLPS